MLGQTIQPADIAELRDLARLMVDSSCQTPKENTDAPAFGPQSVGNRRTACRQRPTATDTPSSIQGNCLYPQELSPETAETPWALNTARPLGFALVKAQEISVFLMENSRKSGEIQ